MVSLTTQINAVIVYPDRARLSRTGKAAVEPGRQTLEIGGLPWLLESDSLRVEAAGTARARLLGVQASETHFAQAPAEAVQQLEARLEALGDDLKRLDLQADNLQKERAALETLRLQSQTFAQALAAGDLSLEQQWALFDGLRSRLLAADEVAIELAARRRQLERQRQQVAAELDALRNARPRRAWTAQVEFDVSQGGDLSVTLSYLVRQARWQPLYDLRLDQTGDKPRLEVGYLAEVVQETGEAWEGVSLALSTARPALAGNIPELEPWYIEPLPARPAAPPYRAQALPKQVMMAAAAVDGLGEAGAAPPMEFAAAPAPVEAAPASVEGGGVAVTYRAAGSATIPPDGTAHKVSVAQITLPAALDYVCAPEVAEAAYRRLKAVNDSPYTFLPGRASLFNGEEFIGATRLEFTAPQAELELFLGAEDRLRVERRLERRDVDRRLIGGKRRLVYGYEIELENLLPGPAALTLRDRLPASRHEDIKVRLENNEPRPASQSELNLLEWELTLARGEKRIVRFDFSIEFPQTMEVAGLP